MGFGYLLIGFLFLCNPVIHILDVLPDCIGYFLIVKGLTKTAFFVDRLAEARRNFWRLALIDLIKFFAIVFWPYVSDSAMLLITFVFSLVELLYFIPAISHLYEGMQFAALWYQGDSVYAKKSKQTISKQRSEDGSPVVFTRTKELGIAWRYGTIVFFCIRLVMTILPELTALQLYDYVGDVEIGSLNYVDFKPMFYLLLGFIVLISGIIWYISTFRYWRQICKDSTFQDNLRRKYEMEILPDKALFISIRMKRVTILFSAAVITSLFLIIDGVNIMIGAISSFLLILAAIYTGKYMKLAYSVIPVALGRMIFSIWSIYLQYQYFQVEEYTTVAVGYWTKAYEMYYFMAFIAVIEFLFAMVSVILFLVSYMKAIRQHLTENGVQTEHAQYNKHNRDLETYSIVGSRLLLNAILAISHYTISCAYHYAAVSIDMMSSISIVVTLVWIAQTIFTVSLIEKLVYNRISDKY